MNYAELLNPSQLNAVEQIDGASVIVAGAGSGKTRVLTYKISYLIEQGIPSDNILALTFTNKAAREMRNRIMSVVGFQQSRGIWMGTFHSIFSRILRMETASIGYTANYTIFDSADSKSLIKSVIKELGLDEKFYKASSIQNRISAAKNAMMDERMYAADRDIRLQDNRANRPNLFQIYERYQQKLRQSNTMDFDDLLMNTALLFRKYPDILERYQDRFQYILVDEYQDTNRVQHYIVTLLAKKYGNVCVVGDDAQSIYSFRGAEIENILSFRTIFPDCKLFKLEQNYRSTQTIVDAANSLILHNRRQIPKKVYSKNDVGSPIRVEECIDDYGEANKVAEGIEKIVKGHFGQYQDIAILYRTNAQSRVLEDCFRQRNIPYKIYGGLSFYQRKEIKDIIAYLRLTQNHEDIEALRRIINVPARKIGETTFKKIESAKMSNLEKDTIEMLMNPGFYIPGVNSPTAARIAQFGDMIRQFSEEAKEKDAYSLVEKIFVDSGLMGEVLSDLTPEGISRKENLEEFVKSVHEFCDRRVNDGETDISLGAFLSEVSLITDQDDDKKEQTDSVSMMTMHSAKGLEFDFVFVVGVEENLLPSLMAVAEGNVEEERRLLYVAITRAKSECSLSYAKSRFLNGQTMFSKPSRFIEDIDMKYLRMSGRNGRYIISKSKPESSGVVANSSAVLSSVCEGERVLHSKFGMGTVIMTEGTGDNARAKIRFDSAGEKTLVLKFARLQSVKK